MPYNWPPDDLTVKEKIGVGTETPAEKLEVKGKIKLDKGMAVDEISSDGTFANATDSAVPTNQAVKTYVDDRIKHTNTTLATQITNLSTSLETKADKIYLDNQIADTKTTLNAQVANLNAALETKADLGVIKGKGFMAGIWAAQPLTDIKISSSGGNWQNVPDTSVSFNLDRDAVIFCTYSINVQPDGDSGGEWLATRLVVDGTAHRSSGSHNQPYTSGDSNINLNGNLVIPVSAGAHSVAMQWLKPYNNVPSWSSFPSWGDGFIGGRSLVVMAFYQ